MDLSMPVMDGLQATKILRAKGCDAIIIGVTANASDQDRSAGFDSGMDEFLTKPLRQDALTLSLKSFVK